MKGVNKAMTTVFIMVAIVGIAMIALSITLALSGCGTPKETEDAISWGQHETENTKEDAAPGEITRIKLVEGLTIKDVDMVRPEGIEYILSMLDVDTYELVDPEHERAVAAMNEASTILEFYTEDELYGMAWVTDTCEVVVIVEGGGVWYTQTPAVDTVLITAEFGRDYEKP